MADLPPKPIETLLARVPAPEADQELDLNPGHRNDVNSGLSKGEYTPKGQELGQVITALSTNAQIGRLSGNLEQLNELARRIEHYVQEIDEPKERELRLSQLEAAREVAQKLFESRERG